MCVEKYIFGRTTGLSGIFHPLFGVSPLHDVKSKKSDSSQSVRQQRKGSRGKRCIRWELPIRFDVYAPLRAPHYA
jgi:hypothetical protein